MWLHDYSHAYILVKRTINIVGEAIPAAARVADERNKEVIFRNYEPFTECISEINNSQIDNSEYLDILMTMYNLIEYKDNYSKKSGNCEQFYRYKQNDPIKLLNHSNSRLE